MALVNEYILYDCIHEQNDLTLILLFNYKTDSLEFYTNDPGTANQLIR